MPEHDRIVALRGSIIDYAYSNSYGPAVLLIMDRLKYDLYTAIERKLKWLSRYSKDLQWILNFMDVRVHSILKIASSRDIVHLGLLVDFVND